MKLICLLSAASLLGLANCALALSTDRPVAPLFALATAVLMLLVVVRDYAPRRPLWQPFGPASHGLAKTRAVSPESMRLVA